MRVMDIKPTTALNYSTRYLYRDPPRQSLVLGCDKTIYLFFELPAWLFQNAVHRARLILYKLPVDDHSKRRAQAAGERYVLCPLQNVFNPYGYGCSHPCIDSVNCSVFWDTCCGYTEIDITDIVAAWLRGDLENNGLLLRGGSDADCVFYASQLHTIAAMRPAMRLSVEDVPGQGILRGVSCDVRIAVPKP